MSNSPLIDENRISTEQFVYLNKELTYYGYSVMPLPRGIQKQKIALIRGSLPWQVNDEVSDHEVWHYYDMPTLGIFDLNGSTYCYNNFGAPDVNKIDDSIWLYGMLTPSQAKDARREDENFDDAEVAIRWLFDCLAYNPITVAMWTDEGLSAGKDFILVPKTD